MANVGDSLQFSVGSWQSSVGSLAIGNRQSYSLNLNQLYQFVKKLPATDYDCRLPIARLPTDIMAEIQIKLNKFRGSANQLL